MDSTTKAEKYLNEGRIFPLFKSSSYDIWGIEGGTGIWSVIVDHNRQSYKSNCKNVRNKECSHKKAIRKKYG
jgi:hypothetical protein